MGNVYGRSAVQEAIHRAAADRRWKQYEESFDVANRELEHARALHKAKATQKADAA